MRTQILGTRLPQVLATLASLALSLAAGCDGGGGVMCSYDGKVYKPGDSFPSSDGCNSCGCSADGSVACTLRACLDKTCLYEGKVYNPGDSFPSSDGCNTCTCGADGAVGCTKKLCTMPATTSWLIKAPVQCSQNPWQLVTSKGDGTTPTYPDPELAQIDNFFEDKGIDLVEVGLIYPPMPLGACTACTCPRGDFLLVRARAADASRLIAEFGFSTVGDADALGYTPRQCDTNPWTPARPLGSRAEAESASAWTASQGAPLSKGGFVSLTTPAAVCLACSCPRGDRLVGFPEGATSAGRLTALSFSPLPR